MSKLVSLPKLPVVRDTYCSQEMTDKICDHFEKYKQDELALVLEQEHFRMELFWSELDRSAVPTIKQNFAFMEESVHYPMAMIDVLYELSRRIRTSNALIEILPQGDPLTSDVGKICSFISNSSLDKKKERWGLTDEIMRDILKGSVTHNYNLWFYASEAIRRNIWIGEISVPFAQDLEKRLDKNLPNLRDVRNRSHLRVHATQLIYDLCKISKYGQQKLFSPDHPSIT